MKVEGLKQTVERYGEFQSERKFTIEMSGHISKLLSETIYSDKIAAVIREYSCNAYDAHVLGNCTDKPFYVHMPTRFEQWFAVRDYGPGLSKEEIITLFTTYGASSKRESDDFIGCLGIGSKSGFAYSDAFNVTSWHAGIKYTYSCFKDEEGMFSVALLDSQTSPDPSGVEVQIPVADSDVSQFNHKAYEVYKGFDPRPVFNSSNMYPDSWDVWDKSPWNNDLKILGKTQKTYFKDLRSSGLALQGNVLYALDQNSFTESEKSKISLIWSVLNQNEFCIRFPIGALDIAASREALSYNDRTRANIIDKLLKIEAILTAQLTDDLKKLNTLYEKNQFCRGHKIFTYDQIADFANKRLNDSSFRDLKRKDLDFYSKELEFTYGGRFRMGYLREEAMHHLDPECKYVLMDDPDKERHIRSIFKKHFSDKDKVFLVTPKYVDDTSVPPPPAGTPKPPKVIKRPILDWITVTGNPNYILLSTLEKPKIVRNKGAIKKLRNFILTSKGFDAKDTLTHDPSTLYWTYKDGQRDLGQIRHRISIANKFLATARPIIALANGNLPKGAETFQDYAEKGLLKFIQNNKEDIARLAVENIKIIEYLDTRYIALLPAKLKAVYDKRKATTTIDISTLRNIAEYFSVPGLESYFTPDPVFEKEVKDACKENELFLFLASNGAELSLITEYLKLKETKNV